MAVAELLAHEYEVLATSCGLIDRSERGKLALTGPDAKEMLTGQVTQDVLGLEPGTGAYAAFLTHKGKMLGDLRILDRGDELHLDCERVSLQELFNLIRRAKLGFGVELHKRTLETALFSLIGPRAREVAGIDPGRTEHDHAEGPHGLVVATDLGVDVLVGAGRAEATRAALVAAGAHPVSEAAGEVLRVEHGRPRYGIDLSDSTIPQEAGLNERAVSFTKGCYVGQETVARLHYRGKPNRHLRGLRLSEPAETGTPIHLGEKEVGTVGSSVVSPRLGPIALALVRREVAPGDQVTVGTATAEVVELPFQPPQAAA
jgi:folate-binding protein YgfZ